MERGRGRGDKHLSEDFRLGFSSGEAVADEGSQHVVAVFFVGTVSLAHHLLGDAVKCQKVELELYWEYRQPTPSAFPCRACLLRMGRSTI